jgi:hypothetical protein
MDRAYHRRADGSVHQEDASYIEEMRKDGVPVLQWSVLLLLLGGLFYSLYSGSGKKKSRKADDAKAKAILDRELEKVVAAIGSVEPETTKTATKKKSKKPKPSATKPKTTTPKAIYRPATTIKSKPFDSTVPTLVKQDDDTAGDQAGWQVVGALLPKTAAAEVAPKKAIQEEEMESKEQADSTVELADIPTDLTNGTAVVGTAVDLNGKASVEEAGTQSRTKKKRGNKITHANAEAAKGASDGPKGASTLPTEASGEDATEAPTMDGDAALALKLQKQEEKMADPPATSDTTWEEVTQKKRRAKV